MAYITGALGIYLSGHSPRETVVDNAVDLRDRAKIGRDVSCHDDVALSAAESVQRSCSL